MEKFNEIEKYLVDISVGEIIVNYQELFLDRFCDGFPVNIDSYCDVLHRELLENNFDEDLIFEYIEIVKQKYNNAEEEYAIFLEDWQEERREQMRSYYADCL